MTLLGPWQILWVLIWRDFWHFSLLLIRVWAVQCHASRPSTLLPGESGDARWEVPFCRTGCYRWDLRHPRKVRSCVRWLWCNWRHATHPWPLPHMSSTLMASPSQSGISLKPCPDGMAFQNGCFCYILLHLKPFLWLLSTLNQVPVPVLRGFPKLLTVLISYLVRGFSKEKSDLSYLAES